MKCQRYFSHEIENLQTFLGTKQGMNVVFNPKLFLLFTHSLSFSLKTHLICVQMLLLPLNVFITFQRFTRTVLHDEEHHDEIVP